MAATAAAGMATITTIGTTIPTVTTHAATAVAPFATSSAAPATFLGDTTGKLNDINSIDTLERLRNLKFVRLKGDENTKFFHGILNSKCSQLAICKTLVDGEWIVEPLAVKSVFLKYFSTQFTSHVSPRICFAGQFTNRLSLEQQADLERNVSNEEIKSAVWDCGTNKSPGPDGFTFEFFCRYWKLLEHDCNNLLFQSCHLDRLPTRLVNNLILSMEIPVGHHHRLTTNLDPITPPSPDNVPGPEHQPSPDYVPGLEYPEYLVPYDDEYLIEDQPLPAVCSPNSPYNRAMSDSILRRRNPKEDPEEDPAYEEMMMMTSHEDKDDDEEEDEEEKHLAPTDSTTLLVVDPVPSAEDTKAFKTDESEPIPTHTSPTYAEAPLGYRAAMIRSRAASSSPLLLHYLRHHHHLHLPHNHLPPQIPSPPLPLPSPPLQLPAPSPPLLLLATDRKEDVPEADVPPRKRLCLTAPAPRFEVGESLAAAAARQPGLDVATMDATPVCHMSREAGYGITDVWDDMVGDMEGRALTTLEELS
ncbi:hypothetical protein Tco_0670828 [Tanacetum coccineum]